MAAKDELLIAKIRAGEDDPATPELENTLHTALESLSARVVSEAAKLIGEQLLKTFSKELHAAFDRFMVNSIKSDPGCVAKTDICHALRLLEYDDEEFFQTGISYRQSEPHYGGAVDTAAELRVVCGFSLLQLSGMRAMDALVDLLLDPEKTARAGAIRAIAHARCQTSELILRLKMAMGDLSAEVMGECFSCLLQLDAPDAVGRVAEFLDNPDEGISCEAALALSEVRSNEVFRILKAQAERPNGAGYQQVLLTAIGLLGQPESVEYLLQVVIRPDVGSAIDAIRALRHCRDHKSFAERLSKLVYQSDSQALRQTYAEEFPSDQGGP